MSLMSRSISLRSIRPSVSMIQTIAVIGSVIDWSCGIVLGRFAIFPFRNLLEDREQLGRVTYR